MIENVQVEWYLAKLSRFVLWMVRAESKWMYLEVIEYEGFVGEVVHYGL